MKKITSGWRIVVLAVIALALAIGSASALPNLIVSGVEDSYSFGSQMQIYANVTNPYTNPGQFELHSLIVSDAEYPLAVKPISLQLEPGESKKVQLYSMKVDEGMLSGDYVLSVRLLYSGTLIDSRNKTFSVRSYQRLTGATSICGSEDCEVQEKVFEKGELVFIDFISPESSLSARASVIHPDNSTEEIDLPAKLTPEDSGTYTVKVSATKENFLDYSGIDYFAVISQTPSIAFEGTCVADGQCKDKETLQNCPQDCLASALLRQEQKLNYMYITLCSLLFIFILLCFTYFEYMRFTHRRDEDLELKNYVLTMVSRGFTPDKVKEELRKSNWREGTLKRIFSELEKYDLKKIQATAIREKEIELKKYVFGMLKKGYPESQVRKDLQRSGWPEMTLKRVFSELSVYQKKPTLDERTDQPKAEEYVTLEDMKKGKK